MVFRRLFAEVGTENIQAYFVGIVIASGGTGGIATEDSGKGEVCLGTAQTAIISAKAVSVQPCSFSATILIMPRIFGNITVGQAGLELVG